MRSVHCFDCLTPKIVLRGNINRAIRRHFVNVHGPEVSPGVFLYANNNTVEFIDRKARKRIPALRSTQGEPTR